MVDLGPPGPTHGDLRVHNAPLYNEHATTRIGRFDGVCTVTDPADEPTEEHHIMQCLSTFSLPDGEITVQGVGAFSALTEVPVPQGRAITGGTGAYQTARGETHAKRQGEQNIFTIQLILTP